MARDHTVCIFAMVSEQKSLKTRNMYNIKQYNFRAFIYCLSFQFHKQDFDTLLQVTGRVAVKSENAVTNNYHQLNLDNYLLVLIYPQHLSQLVQIASPLHSPTVTSTHSVSYHWTDKNSPRLTKTV